MKNLRIWMVVGPLVAMLIGTASPVGAGAKLWELADPRGDDHGDGGLLYPTVGDFAKGELDVLSVVAEREGDGTEFAVTFARPVRTPSRGAFDALGTPMDQVFRFGFYTFNIDLYVDRDRQPGSGGVSTLPGRKAQIAPEFAWDRAICLTPRPNEARELLSKIVLGAMTEVQKAEGSGGTPEQDAAVAELKKSVPADLETRVYFPNRVRVRGNTVSFFVPDSFLGAPASPDWGYLLVVTAADIHQETGIGSVLGLREQQEARLMNLPISPGSWRERLGGGRENGALQPPVVDLLVPPGESQERLLRGWDAQDERPVVLPGVVPAEIKP
ncbi:MAG TPA: glucodextranase DOMON-like domain-containing protein [Thermoanaerobaculia bacterium]|nr:glucodextranase DOMON-like domain-containing protein [Thermoanaerobaculia bacterium]